MNKLEHQKILFWEYFTEGVSEIIDEDCFSELKNENGYLMMDDNYFCIMEQLYMEKMDNKKKITKVIKNRIKEVHKGK